MKIYNKLVRDNIPQIIKDAGKKCKVSILDDEKYLIELKRKVIEEAQELTETKNRLETIEELADIFEVLDVILAKEKISMEEILATRIEKNNDKGAFEQKIFLKSVE